MKSLTLLWQEVANEMATRCRASTNLDIKYVKGRVEKEGIEFFSISLPAFGADFQKSLDAGRLRPGGFRGFKRRKSSYMPRFLSGFMRQVFDDDSGCLLDDPNIEAIFAIRQLTLMFGKIELECTEERIQAAMDGYVQLEQEVREHDKARDPSLVERFRAMSAMLFAQLFQDVDEDIFYGRLVPKHGPGATADRLTGNRKFEQSEWTDRLERVFPAGEYLLPNWRYHELLADLTWLEPGQERPVKVTPVPKTLKAPRIIAIEPTCMQYTQQAVMQSLVGRIEKDDILSDYLGFRDQEPNRRMACEGSIGSRYSGDRLATLDLSEASDRVSNQLVRAMVGNFPHLAEGIDATRSRKADVPGHGVIRLAKYASMGSALCFPIEAMVFLTIVMIGIENAIGTELDRTALDEPGPERGFRGLVRVYGDDIVVPVPFARSVIEALEAFGLLVNRDKSFWSGNFRESCGKEYYDGNDVSITRVRRLLPSSLTDVQEIVSSVSLRNHFYMNGLWSTAAYLDDLLTKVIPMPTVKETSPVLGRVSLLGFETQRTHPFSIAPSSGAMW
uniref:RNA-directed RNA polymerase n=1 Tax=Leviviridae sp. TaxID=2027243 RepID=A0A514D4Z3_9VIRU|nr:MAG: RNA-dependent RNA polymerase [Leviviridae sp.]